MRRLRATALFSKMGPVCKPHWGVQRVPPLAWGSLFYSKSSLQGPTIFDSFEVLENRLPVTRVKKEKEAKRKKRPWAFAFGTNPEEALTRLIGLRPGELFTTDAGVF